MEILTLKSTADSLEIVQTKIENQILNAGINGDSIKEVIKYKQFLLQVISELEAEIQEKTGDELYKLLISNDGTRNGKAYAIKAYLNRISTVINKPRNGRRIFMGLDPQDDPQFKYDEEAIKKDFAQYYFWNNTKDQKLKNLYKFKIEMLNEVIRFYNDIMKTSPNLLSKASKSYIIKLCKT
ncbi:hypothetical protein MYP_3582 [Sporocytophaga myxococcoides]|uniref:Uncharacterized protein n=1 Tax=Sporocytophaga myxococcoides TaxID=153721 RepID=A0A098LJT0_9BACT|nr:hypothetical protein [Sporocytophaga myxococcoides]GAL86353.1 hypothetical protein MYP_3582 [Sporocytophaga myxococcoides]